MREGLYRVQFQTPLGWGSGVIHALNGRLWGGDAAMFYTGNYTQDGNQIAADVRTGRHTQNPAIPSVFGRDQVRIRLMGVEDGDLIRFTGSAPEAPNLPFTAELNRISD
jgi:hypothetical protein